MADIPTLREGMPLKAGGKEWVLDKLVTYSHTLRQYDGTCVNCNKYEPTREDDCAPPTVILAREKTPANIDAYRQWIAPGNTPMGIPGLHDPVPAFV